MTTKLSFNNSSLVYENGELNVGTINVENGLAKVQPVSIGTVSSFSNVSVSGSSIVYTSSNFVSEMNMWNTIQTTLVGESFYLTSTANSIEDPTLQTFYQTTLPSQFTTGDYILLEGYLLSGETQIRRAAIYQMSGSAYYDSELRKVIFPGSFLLDSNNTTPFNDTTNYWTSGESNYRITRFSKIVRGFGQNQLAPEGSSNVNGYVQYTYNLADATVLRFYNYDVENAALTTQLPAAASSATSIKLYVNDITFGMVMYEADINGTPTAGDGYYDIPVSSPAGLGIGSSFGYSTFGETTPVLFSVTFGGASTSTTYNMSLNTGTTVNKTEITKLFKNGTDVTATHLSVLTPNVSSSNTQYSSATNYETLFTQGDVLTYLGASVDLLTYVDTSGNTQPIAYYDTPTDSLKYTGIDVTLQKTKNTVYTSDADAVFKANVADTSSSSYFYSNFTANNTSLGTGSSVGMTGSSGSYVIGSTAIGAYANSGFSRATAVGAWSRANGDGTVAIGAGSLASYDSLGGISVGKNAAVTGTYSVALGYTTTGYGQYTTQLGSGQYLPYGSDYTTLIGSDIQVYSQWAYSVGISCTAPYSASGYSVTIGKNSQARGSYSTAVGYNSVATSSAVSLGNNAWATSTRGVAVGESSGAYGIAGVAIGYAAQVSNGTGGVALGNYAKTTGGAASIGFGNLYTYPNQKNQKIWLNYASNKTTSTGKIYFSSAGSTGSGSPNTGVYLGDFGSSYDGQLWYGVANILIKASHSSYPNDWKIVEVKFSINGTSAGWTLNTIKTTVIADGGGTNQSNWTAFGFEMYVNNYLNFYVTRSDSTPIAVSCTVELDQLTKAY